MDFDSFLQAAGFKPGTRLNAATVREYQRKHAEYVQQMATTRQPPEVRELEMPMSGRQVITMGNTMQVMPDRYAQPRIETGEGGVLLNVIPSENRATVITNTDGSPVRVMQKPNPYADVIAALGGGVPSTTSTSTAAAPALAPTPEPDPTPATFQPGVSFMFAPPKPPASAGRATPQPTPSPSPTPFAEGSLVRSKKDGKIYRIINGSPVLHEGN